MTDRQIVTLDFTKGYDAHTTLAHLRDGCTDGCSVVASLARQIEKQTRPAIEEPKGLGAVVEDGEGDRLTRYCDANDDGEWIGEDGRSWHWGDIDVVRVVWAGVTS